ncbi:MAG: patatin-like phospholipase family protein, partial [Pseudolabrys sp.]
MKKTIALVLGGGAPNLTLMAGAVAALDDAGVKFDVVSTSGAGMLIGLLYAAPKGRDRAAALQNTVNMGVHDAIYRFFPVNFKVFHKPGTLAQAYTKFWQIAADNRKAIEGPAGDF